MESWQDAGTSLYLLARFFPKLQNARARAAARKCIPNLDNPKEPVFVDVDVGVSAHAISAASHSIATRTDAIDSKTTHTNETTTASSSASRTTIVPDPALNSRLYLCTGGLPDDLDVAAVLDVQVTVAHEMQRQVQSVPFLKNLPDSVFCATEFLKEVPLVPTALADRFRGAYARALEAATQAVANGTGEEGSTVDVVGARNASASGATMPVVAEESGSEEEEDLDTKNNNDNHNHNWGKQLQEEQLCSTAGAAVDNVTIDPETVVDDEAFSALIPAAGTSSLADPDPDPDATTATTDAGLDTKNVAGDATTNSDANANANTDAHAQDVALEDGCVVIPFPLGFSHPTAVTMEDYAANFTAVLREMVSGPNELLRKRKVVVVAFDVQQQALLETCFQAFFPVAS